MNMTGRHSGKLVELVMLKFPQHIRLILSQACNRPLVVVEQEIRRLMNRFDSMPIAVSCQGRGCRRRATRALVYIDTPIPFWWCGTCPYPIDVNSGWLQTVATYQDALMCCSRAIACRRLVTDIARAKGFQGRLTRINAQAFFANDATAGVTNPVASGVPPADATSLASR